MDRFNFKINSTELRSCNKSLTSTGEHMTAEIIEWIDDEKSCYTLAYWKLDKEGYDLTFIGARPFDEFPNDPKTFWSLGKTGQDILDNHFLEGEV